MIILKFCQWRRDAAGQAALVFSLVLVPIMIVLGFAIDSSRQVSLKKHLQYATDAAALAGARTFMHDFSAEKAVSRATLAFNTNMNGAHGDVTCALNEASASLNSLSVKVRATCRFPTLFSAEIMGLSEMLAIGESIAAVEHRAADVAMMFDLSRSMSTEELDDLKAAGKRAAELVIGSHPGTRGRVALAPFATGVNAGNFGNKAAGRASGADPENDNRAIPSMTLERVCVTERTGSEAFTDATPEAGHHVGAPFTSREAIDQIRATGEWYDISTMACPDSPVHPLDDNLTAVHAAIDGLKRTTIASRVGGHTSGHMGIAWSWYLISPRWRSVWTDSAYGGTALSAPHAYRDPNHPKIVILMTDGIFQQSFHGDFNGWDYATRVDRIRSAAEQLCDGMRAEGIIIYAVGYNTSSEAEAVLEHCTGDAARVFTTGDSDELVTVYESIAREFLGMRLVE